MKILGKQSLLLVNKVLPRPRDRVAAPEMCFRVFRGLAREISGNAGRDLQNARNLRIRGARESADSGAIESLRQNLLIP
jgi:hypothetical protein